MATDLDVFIEEYDFLDAVMSETEDDWIWHAAEKKFRDVWCIIRAKDPHHPVVIKGEPWIRPGWGPPSSKNAIPLPGSTKASNSAIRGSHGGNSGASLSDDDDAATNPGGLNPSSIDLWGNSGGWFKKPTDSIDPFDFNLDKEKKEPKPKSEGEKLMDFFFK